MKLVKFFAAGIGYAVAAVAAYSSASAAVIGVTIANASSGDYTLTSVSVNRGGTTVTYLPSQLTGVDVTDVDQFSVPLATQSGSSLPTSGTRAALLEDGRLDTGLINITTTNGSADRSLQVVFATPVINSVGEDILLFEVDGGDSVRFWINDDRTGQSADALSSSFSGNLLTGMPYTTFAYNNGGDQDINSLAELESSTGFQAGVNTSNVVRAVGLDLSLVGVPLGGSVSSIRLQSLAGQGNRVDPVFIAGLPAVPEPAGVALAGLVSWPLLLRRKRCSGV